MDVKYSRFNNDNIKNSGFSSYNINYIHGAT